MNKITSEIPFEIHITMNDFPKEKLELFVKECENLGAKPLLILLSRGNVVNQPMLSKIIYDKSLNSIHEKIQQFVMSIELFGFVTDRVKIEIPANKHSFFISDKMGFEKYFEWHGKINYKHSDRLLIICEEHQAHLSINGLKNTKFITLREFGGKVDFDIRINSLINELKMSKYDVISQHHEYCIYDSNVVMDKGWLII